MNGKSDAAIMIENLTQYFMKTRSVFPYLDKNMIGQSKFQTAPFYAAHGFNIIINLQQPLTENQLNEFNELGHWHNQNFVIRLYSILDANKLAGGSKILKAIPGNEDVDIVRRLRHEFSHGRGKYNPKDKDQKTLYDRIISHYGLNPSDHPEKNGKFPIPIDKVLRPMAKACKEYAKAASNNIKSEPQ